MARIGRLLAVGAPHHVTQRGNNRQEVFLSDEDRQFHVATLTEKRGPEAVKNSRNIYDWERLRRVIMTHVAACDPASART